MTHLGALASAYLDGEVTTAESERVRQHLEQCEACRAEMADLHAARSALRTLPTLEVPAAVFAELGLLEDVVPLRRRAVTWVAAAAAAAALFVGAAALTTPDAVDLDLDEVAQLHVSQSQLSPRLAPIGGFVVEVGDVGE